MTSDAVDADITAAQAGDEAAFGRLYRSTQPGLLRYLSVLVGPDAEDVCAEAWLQACRDLPRFRGDLHAFRAWLARIARNRAIDAVRAHRRRPAEPRPTDELHPPAFEASAEDAALDAISTQDAVALIAGLPKDQAEAVMLRAVIGLDAASAATVVGKRPGAVRTAAYRGLRTLATQGQRHTQAEASVPTEAVERGVIPQTRAPRGVGTPKPSPR